MIFQFLDVKEHAAALRICTFWRAAGRQRLAWADRIVCGANHVRYLEANGCTHPKTVVGMGLGRRNFRPHQTWAGSLRVLHMNSDVGQCAPSMTSDQAARTLQGLVVLEELWWEDLHSLPQDFKFPDSLKRLKLHFWITKSCNPPFNPATVPAGLESLSLRHTQAAGTANTVHWPQLDAAIPFHCEKLQSLSVEADGHVLSDEAPTQEFKSTQLRRLHLNVLLYMSQLENVLKVQSDQLEDLKMPEVFWRPLNPDLQMFGRLKGLRRLWIHQADGDSFDLDSQVNWVTSISQAVPKLRDLFLYDDANNSSETLAKLVANGSGCPHADYTMMGECRKTGRVHYLMKREAESDYEPSDSD
jgi:hypothetical protein